MVQIEAVFVEQPDLANRAGGPVLHRDEAKIWQEAYQFLADAKAQFGCAQREAQEAARHIRESAHAEGYAEGRAAGAAEATRLVAETTARMDRHLRNIERQVADLAMDIVRRVLGQFDAADLVGAVATQALGELRQQKILKVTVHPASADRVRAAIAGFGPTGVADPMVEVDAKLDKAACIVTADSVVVDAGIEPQLAAIAAGLRDALS
jgi:type III secretion protein L